VAEDTPAARDELQARWEALWARGLELSERHSRFTESLATMDHAIGSRALEQLHAEQEQHKRDLRELRAAMERHGGFE
jgi:hypothetical protein